MDTKLKNSTKREVELLAAWIIWGMLFGVTTQVFASLEQLGGTAAEYAVVFVIAGTMGFLLSGAVLVVETFQYLSAAWQTQRNRKILMDMIPIEILLIIAVYLGVYWLEEEIFSVYTVLYEYDLHNFLYEIVVGIIRSIASQFLVLLMLGIAAWGVVRQFAYGCFMECSVIRKVGDWMDQIRRRYHVCSALGKKITRRRWYFWLSVAVVVLSAGMAMMFILDWDYEPALCCAGVALAAEIFIIAYQVLSGVTSKDIASLVEQIGAISRADTLDESHKVSEKSIFYEPFEQLQKLEQAIQNSARKQLQAERLKMDLITNVSHDLKTPLTSMVGYVDLLKQEELSPEAKDYIDIISQKQELLKEMIQNLFELSKSTSGVEELHMETLDMRKLLEQILGDMEDVIQESGMTIRTAFDDPPLLFSGDNEKMYRVVQNLLENALKYSLEHTRIYVDVKRIGRNLQIQIKNISNYEMSFDAEEITGRFVRGDRSRTTEGHGLGLAIASSFTQNMGGNLEVEVDGDLFKVIVGFPAVE